MDMLCYMWESAERGVMVKPNNTPYTREEIKRLVGVDSSGSDAWLDELISIGELGVRSDGAFFSRRMVRMEEIRAKRREAGKKGGDVTKGKILSMGANSTSEIPPCQEKPQDMGDLFEKQDAPGESPPPLTPKQKAKAESAKKYKYAEFVSLTRDEYAKLCADYSEDGARRLIEILDNYKGAKGKKYKSDYRAILSWVVDRFNEDLQRNGKTVGRKASSDPGSTGGYRDTL